MSKHFIIDKELESGVVVSGSNNRISFDKVEKVVSLIAYDNNSDISFSKLKDYAETLNALVFALRDDIEAAIEEEQDNSLPDFVGDDTDHIK